MVKQVEKLETTIKMQDGYLATCVEYNKHNDFYIQFEDGFTTHCTNWQSFIEGKAIASHKTHLLKEQAMGTSRTTRSGHIATVIEFQNCHNFTIKWDTGEIQHLNDFRRFKEGCVVHPSETYSAKAAQRVGVVQVMGNGEVARIIAYHNCENIDIEFEDGTIRKGIQYSHFLEGNVRKEKLISNEEGRKERVGETALANNGQQMTIIEYRKVADIDIKFEDGTIVYNKGYYDFLAGEIENPNYKSDTRVSINEFAMIWYFRRLGFERFKQGSLKQYGLEKLELDCFNPVLKIAIEYDGYRWHDGDIGFQRDTKKSELCKKCGIHLIRIRDCRLPPIPDCENLILKDTGCFSQEMECLLRRIYEYLNQEYSINVDLDVDLRRDKEQILCDFGKEYRSSKIGEESINSANLKMKIVTYRTYADIDVEFEDGAIKKNVRYERFLSGAIRHPSQTAEGKKAARINKERIMNCGLSAKIIEYRSATDIDVLFADGSIVKHRTYNCFKKGTIKPCKKRLKR